MVVVLILGTLLGFGAFAPLLFAVRLARKATPTSNISHASALLLGVLLSFTTLVIPLIICIVVERSLALPMTLAEALALSVCACAYGLVRLTKKSER